MFEQEIKDALAKKGITLVNGEKLNRAIYGSISGEGKLVGGKGEDASPEEILAEYDRLGGLVKKNGQNVKMGCFYNFDAKKAHAKPKVVLVFKDLRGRKVELGENDEVPIEVKAQQKLDKEDADAAEAAKAKTAKGKGKGKAAKKADEFEEEEQVEEAEGGEEDEG